MSESEVVFIAHGKRQGRTLSNEKAFRTALAEGKRVVTGGPNLNGVWFEVTLREDGSVNYWPHPKRPEGV